MSKKKVQEPNPETIDLVNSEFTPEQIDKARKETRQHFNEKFSKWIEIAEEDADDDFLQLAKKEFDEQVESYKNNTYKIAEAEDGIALRSAEFLKNWNYSFNEWNKGMWRGIISFDKVITNIIEELKKDDKKDFIIDYSTLIFLYNSMMNPHGIGLESAKAMAKMENYNIETDAPYEEDVPVTYSGILEEIIHHVEILGLIDKKLAIYQERVRIAAAGLKMNLKISELEEFKEFHDAWVVSDVPTDPNELRKIANS